MASVGSIRLIGDSSGAVELTAPTTGKSVATEQGQTDFIAYLKNDAAVAVGGTIEHSPDGELWVILDTFSGVSNSAEILPITGPVLGQVRANLSTVAGTSNVICELRYDKRGK